MSRADLPDGASSASPSWSRPTRRSGAVFAAKAMALRTRRAASDLMAGPTRLGRAGGPALAMVVARSRTPLWADEGLAERAAQLGKVQNLRVACRALDGLVLPADATFSFWRQVGPPSRGRGYARGRMLREGCMVLSVGGGLCQLSNALYDVATRAGCRITERHAHSRIVPGSLAAAGRDATVAWNYVDLRFVADRPLRLAARLDRDDLVVELLGAPRDADAPRMPSACDEARPTARSCAVCGETRCHRNEQSPAAGAAPGRHAFLVDEAWPEFRAYLAAEAALGDQLAVPLDGARLGLARYTWPTAGRGGCVSAPLATLSRAWAQRAAGALMWPVSRNPTHCGLAWAWPQ